MSQLSQSPYEVHRDGTWEKCQWVRLSTVTLCSVFDHCLGTPNPIQKVDSYTLHRPRKRTRFDNLELPSSPPQIEASSSRGSGGRVSSGHPDISHQSTILTTSTSEEGLLRAREDFSLALEDLKEELHNSTSIAFSEMYALAKVWQLREDLFLGL